MPKRSAQDYAAFLISRRARTRAEIERKLIEKKYSQEDIAAVLKLFEKAELINDRRFAQAYVADKLEFNRRGKYRMTLELHKKGVAKSLIEEAISQVRPEDELAAAKSLVASRERQWRYLEPLRRKARLISLLQRRGFSPAIIHQLASQPQPN